MAGMEEKKVNSVDMEFGRRNSSADLLGSRRGRFEERFVRAMKV
jgi:hypothetical protein